MKAEDAADSIGQDRAEDRFKRYAAVLIAFFAMLLAITGLGSNNAMKDALNENIQASNAFAFFQAKNIRQTSFSLAADQIELALLNDPNLPASARAALDNKMQDYRKTGARYAVALEYHTDGQIPYVIASNYGQEHPPAWYLNLLANPTVEVERDGRRYRATASVAEPAERDRIWARLVRGSPYYARYQRRVSRQIPIILLRRE